MRKIISLFLTLTLFCLGTIPVSAASATKYFSTNYTLTGDPAADMVAVAFSQLNKKMYSYYGEPWCADFLSDLAKIINQTEAIPANPGVRGLYNAVIKGGGYEVSTPKAGDLCFYYCKKCEYLDGKPWVHVGLCINSTQSIDGNYNSKVALNNRNYNDGAHYVSTGEIRRIYVRPNYQKTSAPSSSITGTPCNSVPTFSGKIRHNYKVDAFSDEAMQNYIGRIYVNDLCDIVSLSSAGVAKVQCPWDGWSGKRTVYTKFDNFINTNSGFRSFTYTTTASTTTYTRADKMVEFGYTGKGDLVYVVDKVGDLYQVIYPVAATNSVYNGYKLGWTHLQ